MSSPWRETLHLLLAPHRVALRRSARGWRPAIVQSAHAEIDSGDVHWAAAVDALAALLASAPARGADAHVIVSNHFVRYALVPDNVLLVTQDDRLRYARHNFVRVHGPAAERWSVRVGGAAGAAIASAVEPELVDALRALLARNGLRACALQPALMAAFNAVRSQLPAAGVRLFVVEPGIAVSATWRQGWRRVRSHRLAQAPAQELPMLIDRERALDDDADDAPVCVLPLLPVDAAFDADEVRTLPPLWPDAASDGRATESDARKAA
ncbi:hypothetical protein FBR04_16285 [Betaproteobacteria bacterium PRO7]|nr:hypothetical protein [Betaproteobacteria bacterium PRO7]